jgi:GNAT superfamily N-acetyltransferase
MEEVVQIREAIQADFPAILTLYRELDATHQVLDVGLQVRDDKGRAMHLGRAFSSKNSRFSVATSAGRLVAFCIASFAHRRPDVLVEALCVSRRFRRSHIGTKLMKDVESWARRRGARFVELNVYDFNPEARAFYESLGYLTASRTLRKDPDFDGTPQKVRRR